MENKNFIAFEYATKKVKAKEKESSMDILKSLGYEITEVRKLNYTREYIEIDVKRDRKIKHKNELIKLEKRINNELSSIDKFQKKETVLALAVCLAIGLIGAFLIIIGMIFSTQKFDEKMFFVLGIIMGILGLCICSTNDLIYKRIVLLKAKYYEPLIEKSYEKVIAICENACSLLGSDDL